MLKSIDFYILLLKTPQLKLPCSQVVFLKVEPYAKGRNTGKSPKLEILITVFKGQFSKDGMLLLENVIPPRVTARTS